MARRRNLIEILIDRVDNVNVFNIIKEDDIVINEEMRTIIDQDLINEYMYAVKRVYNVFVAEHAHDNISDGRMQELKEISMEFYNHLVPQGLKDYLENTQGKYLLIRPDNLTEKIPWELLHDGEDFLSGKFYMGRGPKCNLSPKNKASLTMPVKILIIIDPSGTLEWAKHEAQVLQKQLEENFNTGELLVEVLSNKELSKLKIMNAMRGKDIIHFTGHSVDDPETGDAGWKIGKNKLLKTREIEKANINPVLVFSHSCKSAGKVAKAFLKNGVRHFIGCRQDVLETAQVINFVSRFYKSVLNGQALGRAFSDAMHKYNKSGLLSFNYVLFSNPLLSIQTFNTQTGKKTFLKPEDVINKFPFPVAESYRRFLVAMKRKRFDLCMNELENSVLWITRFFSYIIITDLKDHSLFDKNLTSMLNSGQVKSWKDFLFSALSELINLRQELKMPDTAKVFYLQKENIEKMLGMVDKFNNGKFEDEELPELITVTHYLLDSLLLDLLFITRYDFIFFLDDGMDNVYRVAGLNSADIKIKEIEIHKHFDKGRVILYDNIEEKSVADLSEFVICEIDDNEENIKVKFFQSIKKTKYNYISV